MILNSESGLYRGFITIPVVWPVVRKVLLAAQPLNAQGAALVHAGDAEVQLAGNRPSAAAERGGGCPDFGTASNGIDAERTSRHGARHGAVRLFGMICSVSDTYGSLYLAPSAWRWPAFAEMHGLLHSLAVLLSCRPEGSLQGCWLLEQVVPVCTTQISAALAMSRTFALASPFAFIR